MSFDVTVGVNGKKFTCKRVNNVCQEAREEISKMSPGTVVTFSNFICTSINGIGEDPIVINFPISKFVLVD